MHSIRRWFYRPKREDPSRLAQFYWADEELNLVAAELDSFDGRKDPERCSALVNQLRVCQDKVLSICGCIMEEAIPLLRANRDFQAKFPDDILQENLSGQLWFGAECLAAGSNILSREVESASMRPLAKALTRALDNVRFLLREQCLRNPMEYSDKVKEALWIFDRLFADFELCYVSAMVPVKSVDEYHLQQEVVVLFSETLLRAMKLGLVSQDLVDDCDPSLMFTIPRLAIVCGLLIFPNGPLNVDKNPAGISELFRPFFNLLFKIRELLWTLTSEELQLLEKTLCSLEDPQTALSRHLQHPLPSSSPAASPNNLKRPLPPLVSSLSTGVVLLPSAQESSSCLFPSSTIQHSKQFIRDFYAHNFGNQLPADLAQPHFVTNCKVADPPPLPVSEAKSFRTCDEESLGQTQNDHQLLTAVFHRLGRFEEYTGGGNTETLRESSGGSSNIRRRTLPPRTDWTADTDEGGSHSLPANANHPFTHFTRSWENSRSPGSRRRHSLVTNVGQFSSPPEARRSSPFVSSSPVVCVPSRVRQLRQSEATANESLSSSCSSCRSHSSLASSPSSDDWDIRSCQSTETSSYHSECQDDEEIALALQAAEIAACHRARAKFRDSTDLIHRLFVCISGVADQLQTNFASDLRNILKCVFQANSSQPTLDTPSESGNERIPLLSSLYNNNNVPDFVHDQGNHSSEGGRLLLLDASRIVVHENSSLPPHHVAMRHHFRQEHGDDEDEEEEEEEEDDAEEDLRNGVDQAREAGDISEEDANHLLGSDVPYEEPPAWVPDDLSADCSACNALFTLIRRRHHCRNCGKIFCSRCSSNSIPLPRYGHLKPVRVCNPCFVFQVTQLLVNNS